MGEEFIGKGLAFPLKTDASGGIALVGREREVEEAIRMVLGTARGERPMRPEFGCGIHDYVFASADGTTAGRIRYECRVAIERWEPRVEVLDVHVSSDPGDQTILYIDVQYAMRGTNDKRNLVFPFYTIPDEPSPY
ncbi:MAG: GPW/gp25 family protein [Actinomycetota bacterium]|nr:GPW/gp25 family protein [Actinomycetota bacterium]